MAYYKKYRRVTKQMSDILDTTLEEDNVSLSESIAEEFEDQADANISNMLINQVETNDETNNINNHLPESCSSFDDESDENDQTPVFMTTTSSDHSGNEFMDLSDSEEENFPLLNRKLKFWATTHGITRNALSELLSILRDENLDLPKDPRTLLGTPRHVDVVEKCSGSYKYFGIKENIQNCLLNNSQLHNIRMIDLFVNIDGIPLFKSKNTQLWPILAYFDLSKIFMIGIYCGQAKPNSVEDYLDDFITEVEQLKLLGINFQDRNIPFNLAYLICDAPARSFLKAIVNHTGYYSCERCEVKGLYIDNRVVFVDEFESTKRTANSFANNAYMDTHQKASSPLIQVLSSCIDQFPLDYMHMVCLGVVRRILNFLKQGPRDCRLSNQHIHEISNKLVSLKGFLPSEFARQPRSLFELDRWKATELREFLLYTGPVVLRGTVKKDVYENFLYLHVALRILLTENNEFREYYLQFARECLKHFSKSSKTVYGSKFNVYNVHGLNHIADDVEFSGKSLNKLSAFPFENHLQVFKRRIKNANNPIAQIFKREKESNGYKNTKEMQLKVSANQKDCCFFIENKVVFIKERVGSHFRCSCYDVSRMDDFYVLPMESSRMNIFLIHERQLSSERLFYAGVFNQKAVYLPYKDGSVVLPLLHI